MMRGAQSGGVVTFAGSDDLMGARARVVNQKLGSGCGPPGRRYQISNHAPGAKGVTRFSWMPLASCPTPIPKPSQRHPRAVD